MIAIDSSPATAIGPSRVRVHALTLAAVCWGALAFGSPYPWAYWPLAAASLACGVSGLMSGGRAASSPNRFVVVALMLVGSAMVLQLLPLPIAWLRSMSPAALDVLAKTDFSYGAGLRQFHSISIHPGATAVALALFLCFAVLLVGLTRHLAFEQPRRLVEAITVFGVFLALVGIVQKPLYGGKLFGFWEPAAGGNPFGPFINRNHFAGWMLMALPLTLALFCAGLEHGMRGVKPGWRHRILWMSSPEANRLILLGAAAMVMALSLVVTMSRSGISALALALVLTGWLVARNLKGRSRRAAGAAYIVFLVVTLVAWVGADAIVARFSEANWDEFNDRRGAWIDAIGVSSAFRLAGTGVNTYETAARFYQRHDLQHFYGESHNDYLELLAEGGLLVGIPIAICLIALAFEIRRRMKEDPPSTTWWLRRGAVTGLVAIGLQETVDFSLQMPGNAVLFVVLCAIALHRPHHHRANSEPEAKSGRASSESGGPTATRARLRIVSSNAFAGTR